jgi:hypothetical protein
MAALMTKLPACQPAAAGNSAGDPPPLAPQGPCPFRPLLLQAAASQLNFPATDYPGALQRFGPELAGFLRQLRWGCWLGMGLEACQRWLLEARVQQ